MALQITENWIRERVGLTHDVLEDVRSLSLPGTYHEKISGLGRSLRGFTRLKNLDLSRNAISSLEGLEQLMVLETLNLYYNNVPDLKELFRLRHNAKLKELDLRLNPVTQNEPDYRLFCIHMLPSLRRLDDRPVRDGERRAALMHFTTDQAALMEEHKENRPSLYHESENVAVPRKNLVSNLGSWPKALDDDDCALIDLISRTGGDLRQPRSVTGSHAVNPTAEIRGPPQESDELLTEFQKAEKREQLSNQTSTIPRNHLIPSTQPLQTSSHKTLHHAAIDSRDNPPSSTDPNLQYTDESDAYTAFRVKGHFTANPQELTDCQRVSEMAVKDTTDKGNSHRYETDVEDNSGSHSEKESESLTEVDRVSGETLDVAAQQLVSLLKESGLVKKKRQLTTDMVKPVLAGLLHPFTQPMSSGAGKGIELRERLEGMNRVVASLNDKVRLQQEEMQRMGQEQKRAPDVLSQSQKEISSLRVRLQQMKDENSSLRQKISSLKEDKRDTIVVPAQIQQKLEQLESDNAVLSKELLEVQKRERRNVQETQRLDNLTAMLQESHKSLVTTNDHLLQELDELRRRHRHEVEQLHWNYQQLRHMLDNQPH